MEPTKAPEAATASKETTKAGDVKATAPADGAGPAVGAPKPVEVMSVPQTPMTGTTPAGGTPQPELNIPMETDEDDKPEKEPVVMIEAQEPLSSSKAADSDTEDADEVLLNKPVTANGGSDLAEKTDAISTDQSEQASESTEANAGEKRKLDDSPADVSMAESPAEKQDSDDAERADKKAKVDAAPDKQTNGGAPLQGKPGRPRKDKTAKTAAPAVGRTARKTRSQGPVET